MGAAQDLSLPPAAGCSACLLSYKAGVVAHGLLYFAAVQRAPRAQARRGPTTGRECTWNRQKAGDSSKFYRLRLKPELFMVLRHDRSGLPAYDGSLCSEAALPLAEAALRIEADPDLRSLFRSVVGCDDDTASEVAGKPPTGRPEVRSAPGPSRLESRPWTTTSIGHVTV